MVAGVSPVSDIEGTGSLTTDEEGGNPTEFQIICIGFSFSFFFFFFFFVWALIAYG